jgi:O-succinylbenzoate synthase
MPSQTDSSGYFDMNLRIELTRTFLPLHTHLREGLFLTFKQKNRPDVVVEASPLPSWSGETIDELYAQAERLIPFLQKGLSLSEPLLPSLAFALDAAFYYLENYPLPSLSFSICALLSGSEADILKKADRVEKEGYSHAKLKIKGHSLPQLKQLISKLKNRFRLRIDCNRAWDLPTALSFFSDFALDDFDYIEEPLQNLEQLPLFSHPFSLDESLRDSFDAQWLSLPLLRAFIIKPTLMGGYDQIAPFLSLGKPLVFSSSFESAIGLRQILYLAHRCNSLSLPLGLDTFSEVTTLLPF